MSLGFARFDPGLFFVFFRPCLESTKKQAGNTGAVETLDLEGITCVLLALIFTKIYQSPSSSHASHGETALYNMETNSSWFPQIWVSLCSILAITPFWVAESCFLSYPPMKEEHGIAVWPLLIGH